jgi:hypothetical protein
MGPDVFGRDRALPTGQAPTSINQGGQRTDMRSDKGGKRGLLPSRYRTINTSELAVQGSCRLPGSCVGAQLEIPTSSPVPSNAITVSIAIADPAPLRQFSSSLCAVLPISTIADIKAIAATKGARAQIRREARKSQGMTQAELATLLDRNQSFVAKYEGGERRLDVVEFIDVALAIPDVAGLGSE